MSLCWKGKGSLGRDANRVCLGGGQEAKRSLEGGEVWQREWRA